MAKTYEPIATTTLGSAQSTVTFDSIPGTYTDLKLVFVGFPSSNTGVSIRLNNNSQSLYSYTEVSGDGSTASSYSTSATQSSWIVIGFSTGQLTSSYPGVLTMNLFSYAGSRFKTALFSAGLNNNAVASWIISKVALWQNTAAVTRIDITADSASFNAGAMFTLYGINAA